MRAMSVLRQTVSQACGKHDDGRDRRRWRSLDLVRQRVHAWNDLRELLKLDADEAIQRPDVWFARIDEPGRRRVREDRDYDPQATAPA